MKIYDKLKETPRHMKYFLSFILVLLVTIITLSSLRQTEVSVQNNPSVEKYAEISNHTVKIKSLAEVNDSSLITVYAQTQGVVTSILKERGQYVHAKSPFLQLSSTYQGANAAAVQAVIAQKQLDNYNNTFDTQIDSIKLQRDLAEKQSQNQEELRKLSRNSSERTNETINKNKASIDEIIESIEFLSGQAGTNDQVESLTQTLNQLEATNNQIISAKDTIDYQASEDNPPAGLVNAQRDISMKQLELQERGVVLNGEILKLQAQSAGIAASLFRPISPFSGELIEIFVNQYDLVSPGMPLGTFKASKSDINLTTYLPFESVELLETNTKVKAHFNNYSYNANITYIASFPTKGDLYAVTVALDSVTKSSIPNESYIELEFIVPTKCNDILAFCYLPLGAVTVTEEKVFANYLVNSELTSLEVDLLSLVGDSVKIGGDVYGKTFVFPSSQ